MQEDPTSAFGFWILHGGQILNIESFNSTHSSLANRWLLDNPGLKTKYSEIVMQYRKIKRDVFPADFVMIELGWIRICKDNFSGFLGMEFYENCIDRLASKELTRYLNTYFIGRTIKVDINNRIGDKTYLIDGQDIKGVTNLIYKNVKRAADESTNSCIA